MKKKAGILINPISGGKSKTLVIEVIKNNFPTEFDFELIVWEKSEQREEIIQKIRNKKYDVVVAAGGDGTINLVATAVQGTDSTMAIIPLGSGNGLARHLKIPLNIKKAIELIGTGKQITIDGCKVNGINFFCASGVGFDAHVAGLFAHSKKRGLFNYLKITVNDFLRYKPESYTLTIDDKTYSPRAFLIGVCNGSQYGNNAYVAPQADTSDGFLDIVVMKPFGFFKAILIGIRIFSGNLHKSSYVDVYKGRQIKVVRNSKGPIHFDGEPEEMGQELNYSIKSSSLKVIVPR